MINFACVILTDSMSLEDMLEELDNPAPVIMDLRTSVIEYTVPDLVRLYNDRRRQKNSLAPISTTGSRPESITIQDS